ncbi:MAG: TIGR03960 family B12-binding radical SAM protein [Clostridia bacterium]|nr:TIGR03960 family B12-binding radical SAM protein [Clostridia bacterium]
MQDFKLDKILPLVQKPARYVGGELNSVTKDKDKVDIRYAFCFPDSYEIGMSHLGIKILYSVANAREDTWCERVFAPWPDMEEKMRENNIPLFALESGDAIKDFDFIGFTLQYELCYTNVLNMLDLAGLPVKAKDRKGLAPIVMGGGPCACNPEPIAEFFDLFSLGEGEELNSEIMDLYKEHKKRGSTKEEFLVDAAKIEGVYVPSLYDISYNEDGTVKAVTPKNGAPEKVTKRIIKDLDSVFYPEDFVVPFIDVVHDRVTHEIFRGCIRGCRFCQAGFLYRPIREKSPEVINEQCKKLCETTGYDEISLCSLSSSDYTKMEELLNLLLDWTGEKKINVALPSLRVDNFSEELMKKLTGVRKSGLTFAPEAGTQRMRDVINKNVTEEEMLETARIAFSGGYCAVKLYFMLGLPTETDEDVEGIGKLAKKVVDEFYNNPDRPQGKGVTVGVSASSFVPKPFTPFQWEPQATQDELKAKQEHLKDTLPSKKINVSFHHIPTSFLEGVFARGDRRLSEVIELAWRKGCKFDGWGDMFLYEKWLEAFEETNVAPEFYANRKREYEEILPWDHLDYGVSKKFLINENKKAHNAETTAHCRQKCAGCGANKLNGGHCDV